MSKVDNPEDVMLRYLETGIEFHKFKIEGHKY